MNVQERISLSKQQLVDKTHSIHRTINTILISCILLCSVYAAYAVRDKFDAVDIEVISVGEEVVSVVKEVEEVTSKFDALTYEEHKTNEIAQIAKDEGYKRCVYNDSLGLQTIGFGHLILPTDNFKCIDAEKAVTLLIADYTYAESSVDKNYPWASEEARLVLINMTYQMGQTGVSKFKKSLQCMQDKDYMCATIELLNSRWASQTSNRAGRLAGRILAISLHESAKQGTK